MVGLFWLAGAAALWGQLCTADLTSDAGTDAQTVCINTPIDPITYTTNATNADFSGLAPGVSGSISGNIITISGTPTTSAGSPFLYSIALSGVCNADTVTGTISVNPVLTPSVSVSVDPGTNICSGDEVTFTATVTYGGINPSFQWTVNGITVGTSSPTYSSSGLNNGDQVIVTVTSDATCPGTGSSSPVTMTVNPVIVPSVIIFESGNNICPGELVTFNAIPENGGTNPSYEWFLNGSLTGNNSDTYSSTTLSDNDQVYVVLTSNAVCANPATVPSNVVDMMVRPGRPATPETISGPGSACPAETGLTYSISPVPGAAIYIWMVPSGWIISSGQGTTTISVTSGNYGQNGNILVTAANSCGSSSASILPVIVNPGTPATPGPITGESAACPDTQLTYSIDPVAHASGYNWTVPDGWNIIAGNGTTTITVTSGTTGQDGSISVTAENDCGESAARNIAVTVNSLSFPATGINVGNNNTCQGIQKILTVTGGSLGTGAEWRWYTESCGGTPAGSGVTINVDPTAGTTTRYYVRAEGPCNTTSCAEADVIVSPAAPSQPGPITGLSPVCPGIAGLVYSIDPVDNADSYSWTVPAGWTITEGQGTNSITVTAGNYGQNGNIIVAASNSCGTGEARNLAVIVSPGAPATPDLISGATEQCINRDGLVYSITAVPNATSYNWTVPDGWIIESGQNTTSITIETGPAATSGIISVTASNTCGISASRTMAVNVITSVPGTPGLISGLTAICPTLTTTYSIDAVPDAINYTWTVPTNWIIVSGQGTTSLTVDVPMNAQSGSITVTANNICGSSLPSILPDISVASSATVYAGPDQVVCYGTSYVQLAGEVQGAIRNHTHWDWLALDLGTFANDRSLTTIYNFPDGGNTTGSLTVRLRSNVNAVGCPYAFDDMVITILPTPTVDDPTELELCNGELTSAINFTGTGTEYTWINSNTSIGLPASGTGNIAPFTALNSGNDPVSAAITVTPVISQSGTSCYGAEQSFTITVNPTPAVNGPADQTVCNGSLTTEVVFTGTATSYNWVNSTPSIGLAASGTGNIPAFTATNSGTTPSVATITVTPLYTNGGTDCYGTPQSFTITVNPAPLVNLPDNQVICNDSPALPVNFTGIATSFNWANDNSSIGLGASGTGSIASFTALNSGDTPVIANITVTPVYSNGGAECTGTSQEFSITVNPTPAADDPVDQTVCNGSSTTEVLFTGTGTSYNWVNSNPSIGLAASGSGDIPVFTATNSGNTPLAATITVTPVYSDGGSNCYGTPQSFTITVNPAPAVNLPVNQVICNGSPTLPVNFTGTATSFVWENDNTSIGLAASGNGNIDSFTVTNAGDDPVTATITVTPIYSNGGVECTGLPQSFTITVNPTSTVNAGLNLS